MGRKTKRTHASRADVAAAMAAALRAQGFKDATDVMVLEALHAWLKGKRGLLLPHGVIGMLAGQQFEQLEAEQPGALASLKP